MQYESERGEQVDDEQSEHNNKNDVVVGVQDKLPVCTIAVQLLMDLLLLMPLVLVRRTHLIRSTETCSRPTNQSLLDTASQKTVSSYCTTNSIKG